MNNKLFRPSFPFQSRSSSSRAHPDPPSGLSRKLLDSQECTLEEYIGLNKLLELVLKTVFKLPPPELPLNKHETDWRDFLQNAGTQNSIEGTDGSSGQDDDNEDNGSGEGNSGGSGGGEFDFDFGSGDFDMGGPSDSNDFGGFWDGSGSDTNFAYWQAVFCWVWQVYGLAARQSAVSFQQSVGGLRISGKANISTNFAFACKSESLVQESWGRSIKAGREVRFLEGPYWENAGFGSHRAAVC